MKGTGLELPRATIGVSRWRRFRAAVDWPLIVTIAAICTIGLLNLYSATRGVRHHQKFDTQVQWMLVGTFGFIVITIIDYRALVRFAWIGLGAAIGLLIVARLLGTPPGDNNHGNTYRWLNLGGMGIQPSELVKLMVILVLARIFEDHEVTTTASAPGPFSFISYAWRYFLSNRGLFGRLAVIAIPIGLIAIQPDLGTSILLTLMVLTVGFLALDSVWPMVLTTVTGLLAIPFVWDILHDYQKNRILGFIDCNVAPASSNCWHTQQSIYAVGSGRILGKGFLEGTQNQFNFVPEHWTDFPYSVWAEEWGFAGSVFLLAIFGFLLVWILNVALSARDRIGAVICIGVAAMTFWHVVVNIAMVLGLAPVVGVTLPFISYGGSSLVTFFLAMGLVANVSLRKHGY